MLGIPYTEAVQMPLDVAAALLDDGRLHNTHQISSKKSNAESAQSNASKNRPDSTTFISTKRKYSNTKV